MTSQIYVQYGCGLNVGKGWLNFDSSPTLRIELVPIVGPLLGRFAGNKVPFPSRVMYGDICRGLPVEPQTARGVYASHVLEHLSLDDFGRALANTLSIMAPGGEFRLIVPDLEERARRYLKDLDSGSTEACHSFMRLSNLGVENRPRTAMGQLRGALGGSAHLWMWDEQTLTKELQRAGFVEVRRCRFGDSPDPMFRNVEDPERFVDSNHDLIELALSARKPEATG